jgi:hypothetical protein
MFIAALSLNVVRFGGFAVANDAATSETATVISANSMIFVRISSPSIFPAGDRSRPPQKGCPVRRHLTRFPG